MSYLENTEKQYSDELAIEIAELQGDIILPEIPTLTIESITNNTYQTAFDLYDDVIGNFYIPILFPLVENGISTELEYDAPKVQILNNTIRSNGYVERNFISLMIPKYIVLQFKDKIPKGTKFLVGFIGGNTDISNINIIGVYGHEL